MTTFTKEELNRYNRQIMLPGFGLEGQTKLKNAKVLVVGAGGLGCPVLQYLCAAGVGTIGIIDFDKIELHNLHRQVLYSTLDVGKPKAETAARILKAQNSHVEFQVYNDILNKKNSAQLISQFDLVVDGSDNFSTRYLVNDTCVELKKPLVYGSIFNYEAQLAVFNHDGGKNLRDIYPEPPNPEDVPGCNENGVLGVVPGILGVYMANTCIQVILGTYNNKSIMLFDFNQFSLVKLSMD
ncbi:MAG: HesA/MoeB/ThiF family protein [Eubacteriaceae bacterium]|nr:HesA/MoeB/ThiF family protein [Eubacteriaceae bacterium]